MTQNLIFLIGSPYSGKTTIIQNLKENSEFEFNEICIGNELRRLAESNKNISEKLSKGDFLSEDIIFDIFSKALNRSNKLNIIIDGYPRKIAQLEFLNNLDSEKFSFYTCFLVIDKSLLHDRFINRKYCYKCHIVSYQEQCTLCYAKLEKRIDDVDIDIFHKRIEDYFRTYDTILFHMSKISKRFFVLDASSDEKTISNQLLSCILSIYEGN